MSLLAERHYVELLPELLGSYRFQQIKLLVCTDKIQVWKETPLAACMAMCTTGIAQQLTNAQGWQAFQLPVYSSASTGCMLQYSLSEFHSHPLTHAALHTQASFLSYSQPPHQS